MENNYIKALKQVLKNNNRGSIPILKCLEHSDGTLKATDLTVMVQVKTQTIADGIWKPEALDYGFKDDTKETEWTSADFPEVKPEKLMQELELTGKDMGKIIRAADFASNDQTRPVLTGVTIKGDSVYGCDGYRLYRNKIDNELNDFIILPPECVKILKTVKADKQVIWTVSVYDDFTVAFTCGDFTVYSKLIDGYPPDYDKLAPDTKFDYVAKLDMKQITQKKDKYISIDKEENKIYLCNRDGTDKILISECIVKESGDVGYCEHKEVVMPLTGGGSDLKIDLAVMKQYKKSLTMKFKEKGGTPVIIEEN